MNYFFKILLKPENLGFIFLSNNIKNYDKWCKNYHENYQRSFDFYFNVLFLFFNLRIVSIYSNFASLKFLYTLRLSSRNPIFMFFLFLYS